MSTEKQAQYAQFMAAINYAADKADLDAGLFLRMWREGDWPGLRRDFPDFDGPTPEIDLGR